MGYVHKKVQEHIVNNAPVAILTEVKFSDLTRADVVCPTTGAVWEIKHAGKHPIFQIGVAQAQASRYVGKTGVKSNVTISELGAENTFAGYFPLDVGENSYVVSYRTPAPGVILYSVRELPKPEPEYAYAYSSLPNLLTAPTKDRLSILNPQVPLMAVTTGTLVLAGIFSKTFSSVY